MKTILQNQLKALETNQGELLSKNGYTEVKNHSRTIKQMQRKLDSLRTFLDIFRLEINIRVKK